MLFPYFSYLYGNGVSKSSLFGDDVFIKVVGRVLVCRLCKNQRKGNNLFLLGSVE